MKGRLLVNFIAFQAGWFACVIGAASGAPEAAVGTAIVVALHLAVRRDRVREGLFVTAVGLLGAAVDWSQIRAGILVPVDAVGAGWGAYFWLLAFWMNFATILNVSLAWLRERLFLALVLGAVFGPLTYLAGARLGALEIGEPVARSLLILGWEWAVALPLMMAAALRVERGERWSASRAPDGTAP